MNVQIPGEVSSLSQTPSGTFVFVRVGSNVHFGIKAEYDNKNYVVVLSPGHPQVGSVPGFYEASAIDGRQCLTIPEAALVPLYGTSTIDLGHFDFRAGMIALIGKEKFLILQTDARQVGYLDLSNGKLLDSIETHRAAWLTEYEIRRSVGGIAETLFRFPRDFGRPKDK